MFSVLTAPPYVFVVKPFLFELFQIAADGLFGNPELAA